MRLKRVRLSLATETAAVLTGRFGREEIRGKSLAVFLSYLPNQTPRPTGAHKTSLELAHWESPMCGSTPWICKGQTVSFCTESTPSVSTKLIDQQPGPYCCLGVCNYGKKMPCICSGSFPCKVITGTDRYALVQDGSCVILDMFAPSHRPTPSSRGQQPDRIPPVPKMNGPNMGLPHRSAPGVFRFRLRLDSAPQLRTPASGNLSEAKQKRFWSPRGNQHAN